MRITKKGGELREKSGETYKLTIYHRQSQCGRNDSWIVGAANRSNYVVLLEADVMIFEFERGLLHAKTLTLDVEVALTGSVNMDWCSFELKYENNILQYHPALTAELTRPAAKLHGELSPCHRQKGEKLDPTSTPSLQRGCYGRSSYIGCNLD